MPRTHANYYTQQAKKNSGPNDPLFGDSTVWHILLSELEIGAQLDLRDFSELLLTSMDQVVYITPHCRYRAW